MTDSRGTRLLAAGLFLLALALYVPAFWVPFYLDDATSIHRNPHLLEGEFWAYLQEYYRRWVTYLTFWGDFQLWGDSPHGYHAVNGLLHAANTVLVFLISRLLMGHLDDPSGRRALWFAVGVAALWAVHPLHTQAVVYIVQRATLMATVWGLLSVYCWIRFRQELKDFGERDRRWLLLAGLSLILAIFSKEFALTVLLVWLVVEVTALGGRIRKLVIPALTLAGLVALLWLLDRWAFQGMGWAALDAGSRETADISRWQYLLTQQEVVIHYLRLFFLPQPLLMEHGFKLHEGVGDTWPFLVPHVGLIVLAAVLVRRAPLVSLGIGWFYVALLVESGLVPIKDLAFEHRMYFPSVGLMLALVGGVFHLHRALGGQRLGQILGVLALAGVLTLSVLTVQRVQLWSDPQVFFQHEIEHAPWPARGHHSLGVWHAERGQLQRAQAQFDRALEGYEARGQLSVGFMEDYMRLLWAQGRYESLDGFFAGALERFESDEDKGRMFAHYANLQYQRGGCPPARPALMEALRLAPSDERIQALYKQCIESLEGW